MFSLIPWGAVVVGVIASVVLGSVWYGAIFGKQWAALNDMDLNDKAKMELAKKGMWKLYVTQMILSAVTVAVLAIVVLNFDNFTTGEIIGTSLLMWLGFVMPTEAGALLWTNKSKSDKWKIFWISTGYQVILAIILGFIVAKFMY